MPSCRLALALLALLTCVTSARAAVTNDNKATATDSDTTTPTVVSYTTGASGSWMTVFVGTSNNVAATAITFGATSLTQRCTDDDHSGGNRITVFDGTVPTSTTANVTVTYGGSSISVIAITSWNGVVGVGNCVTTGDAGGGTTLGPISVPSASTDLIVDATVHSNGGTGETPNAPQAVLVAHFQDAIPVVAISSSTQTGATGTTSDGWSYAAGGNRRTMAAYGLQSVLPPAVPVGSFLLLGVGK